VHFVGVTSNNLNAFEILVQNVKERDLENKAGNEGTV
jgi:hypothetical protein